MPYATWRRINPVNAGKKRSNLPGLNEIPNDAMSNNEMYKVIIVR